MADPPARNGSAAANGASGGSGGASPRSAIAPAPTTAPTSPAASLSSATSRISFAIPSSTPQRAGIKPAPINLDARAGLPPKPVTGSGSAAAAVRAVPNGTPIAATAATASKAVASGLPPKPHSLPPRPGPVNGERVGRMSSALPGPSDHRRPRDRSRSREPGEVSPERERPPPRRRSRSRSRDRDWDRRDRRDGDRYRRERSRSRDRDYDRDRGSRDWMRDRDRPRDRERDRERDRARDRDRDRDFRDRERDRAPRRDRFRSSPSPEKRYSDDDRPNGHGHGHGRGGHWHDSRDRDHDARRGSRYRDDSRSPLKSPERRDRSPLKRARSPDRRTPPRRPSPSPSTKRVSATPAAPPPPPPADDMPPPPPEPANAPPPPPPKSSPPPLPHSRPSSILPSRPLSPRSASAAPSAPRTLAGSSAATPQPEWKPPPSAFRRPGAGNYLVIPDPAGGKDPVKRFDGVFNGVEARSRGDPRLKIPREVRERGNGYMKHRRDGVYAIHYEWDEHTPGPRPPPPPTAVLLTGLSPLTTVDQVSKFLRPYGRIKEIDAKMDVKSGMQLGIVWVKFDGPVAGRTGTAHEVAKTVVRMCDGQRIGLQGAEKVRVVLDGRGLLAEKAVKDEMARRHAPRPKPVVAPTPPVHTLTPRSEGKETPKPAPPRPAVRPPPPRAPKFESFGRNFSSLNRSLPVGRFGPGPGPAPFRAGFGVQDFSRDFHAPSPIDSRDSRRYPRGDFYSPADSRSRSRTPASSSDTDSDDDFRRRRGSPRLAARGPARAAIQKKEADEAAAERVKKALAANGHTYVFIEAKSLPPTHPEAHVRDHFRAFKPETVLSSQMGWYVLFSDDQSAHRAQRVLDKTAVQGHRVNIEVRTPKGEAAGVVEPEKGGWRMLTISKKRPRPVSPKKVRRRRSLTYSSSEEDERKPEVKVEASVVRDAPVDDEAGITVEPKADLDAKVEIDLEPKKKRPPAKEAKPAPKAKKARVEEAAVAPAPAPKPTKAKPKKRTALDKLVAAEAVVDDEDAFWLAQALAHPDAEDALSDAEPDLDDDHPLFHMSGAWRAEGWKKVAATKKSAYLPQRNRATAGAAEAVNAMHGGTAVLATGRTARVEGRRLALDMESTRKAMAPSGPGGATANAEASDVFAFNQLRIRKKRLRFARSAIEGYGLYAMESIQPGEMVCEYVGELCRAAVAEVREQRYMRQGIGSSYLFRVDGDIVCDATFRGSTSRLINHSCEANCNAKIISINGRSKIVLYAKRPISPGEELGYNYCFALESDPALRVPCLCGAPTCRGFLN